MLISKKIIVFVPLTMVAAIILTSILTTVTGSQISTLQSSISRLSADSSQKAEEVQSRTALTAVNERIQELGFIRATTKYVNTGVNLASR